MISLMFFSFNVEKHKTEKQRKLKTAGSRMQGLFSFTMHPVLREANKDRQLTTDFELLVEIFCEPTCFHMRISKPCLSVPHEKKSP